MEFERPSCRLTGRDLLRELDRHCRERERDRLNAMRRKPVNQRVAMLNHYARLDP